MLTHRQAEILQFIVDYIGAHNGVSPTFDDIMEGCGYRSRSSVHRAVTILEERGFIHRKAWIPRGIEVRRLPGGDFVTTSSTKDLLEKIARLERENAALRQQLADLQDRWIGKFGEVSS